MRDCARPPRSLASCAGRTVTSTFPCESRLCCCECRVVVITIVVNVVVAVTAVTAVAVERVGSTGAIGN